MPVGVTYTVTQAVSVQPLAFVTVTQYPVLTVGETTMGLMVVILFQLYVPPPLAVSVDEFPEVMVIGLAIADAVVELTLTDAVAATVLLVASMTVTV